MRTARTKNLPPFFTQVIGSLPRPSLVRDLIDRRDSMLPTEYQKIMDEMVVFAIRLQEYTMVVTKKIKGAEPLFIRDAEFLVGHTDRCTKFARIEALVGSLADEWPPNSETETCRNLPGSPDFTTRPLPASKRVLRFGRWNWRVSS